jgi:diphthine synthase
VALHLVGLGLHDAKDITMKGMERVRGCDSVYAEFYTAVLSGTSHEELERFLGRPVELLDRKAVEQHGDRLVAEARGREVALLTAGDPLAATTHTDLLLRCHDAGVACHVVHAPSIYSAAPGLLGLQHYKFGRTTTLARPEKGWNPSSPFDAVAENHARGLHTLVLLDIQADRRYFMPAQEGIGLLLEMAVRAGAQWFDEGAEVGVVARAGAPEPKVVTGPAGRLRRLDFGPPLHCLAVPGVLHDVERAAWRMRAAPS